MRSPGSRAWVGSWFPHGPEVTDINVRLWSLPNPVYKNTGLVHVPAIRRSEGAPLQEKKFIVFNTERTVMWQRTLDTLPY